MLSVSPSFLAEISDKSPRKLFVFIIYKKTGSKYTKNILFCFEKGSTAQCVLFHLCTFTSRWGFSAMLSFDTNSRYESNTGRIDPHYMCGREKKRVVKCTSTTPDYAEAMDMLEHKEHKRPSLTYFAHFLESPSIIHISVFFFLQFFFLAD